MLLVNVNKFSRFFLSFVILRYLNFCAKNWEIYIFTKQIFTEILKKKLGMTKIVKMRFQAFLARKFKGTPNCQIEERSHKQKCKQTFTNFLSFVILRYLNFCAKNEAKLQLY